MDFVMPDIPPTIVDLPMGHYSISYDIFFHETEDDLPNGWHSHRGEERLDYQYSKRLPI